MLFLPKGVWKTAGLRRVLSSSSFFSSTSSTTASLFPALRPLRQPHLACSYDNPTILTASSSCSPLSVSSPLLASSLPCTSTSFRMMSSSSYSAQYTTKEEGTPGTESFRLYVHDAKTGNRITTWHDIPLAVAGEKNVWNFFNEIPKGTNAKMEMATGEPFTPIKQDVKKGALRFLKHGNVLHNYGCFPQTWENPKEIHPSTNMPGDGDPVDVIEIGSRAAKMGEVYPVKALGVLALIDEGETDWKILAIAIDDPKAPLLNDVSDVEKQLPGVVDAVREWYRIYKVIDGKPPNEYAFGGEAKGRDFAIEVIKDTHRAYLEVQKPKSKL